MSYTFPVGFNFFAGSQRCNFFNFLRNLARQLCFHCGSVELSTTLAMHAKILQRDFVAKEGQDTLNTEGEKSQARLSKFVVLLLWKI